MLNAVNWTTRLRDLAAEARITGAVLGIWHNGEEVRAAHGVLNSGTGVPVTIDSLFQLGSITKLWTATMIMQLVDEGLLTLDTTIAEALPGSGSARPARPARLRSSTCSPIPAGSTAIFSPTPAGAMTAWNATWTCWPGRVRSSRPGPRTPTATAGTCCSAASSRSWTASRGMSPCRPLAGPLALTKTVTLPEEAILAPHRRRAPGQRHPGPDLEPAAQRRAGWAYTATVADLLTFARLHLDDGIAPDGKRLISEGSVAAMQAPAAATGEFGMPGTAVGLGWRLSQWDGRTIIGHDGDTVGQSAYLRIDPETGVAACLLTNSAESQTLCQGLFSEVF